MKIILAAIITAATFACDAATNLLSLTYVDGTNTGNIYQVDGITIPRQKYLLQSLGITNTAGYSGNYTTNGITNCIIVNLQVSVDGVWTTLQTWKPTTTNAVVTNIVCDFDRITLPMRAQVITTNALGVSVFNNN